jgi:hypothetical protein
MMQLRRGSGFLLAGAAMMLASGAQAGLTADDIFRQLGSDDREQLKAGEIVTVSRPKQETSKAGLAIGIAVIVPADLHKTVTTLQSLNVSDDPALRRTTREIAGPVSGDGSSSVFADVRFASDEADEVKKMLAVTPGEDFNFSAKEISWIRAARTNADPAQSAAAVMRRVLANRYLAYQKGGLDALPGYAREDKKVTRPGAELGASADAMPVMRQQSPNFYAAFRHYPMDKGQGIQHQFYWEKKTVEGRPMFSLRHEMAQIKPDGAMIGSREYYISNQLNALQVAIALIPYGSQTMAVLVNETYTDKIASAPHIIAAPVGRRIVESNIRPLFEKLQKALGRARPAAH